MDWAILEFGENQKNWEWIEPKKKLTKGRGEIAIEYGYLAQQVVGAVPEIYTSQCCFYLKCVERQSEMVVLIIKYAF